MPPFAGPAAAGGEARLRTVSWNVAAVNNNPFEYWITHPNPAYKQLMEQVERFIVDPGEDDVLVKEVFTDEMFQRVVERIKKSQISEEDKAQLSVVSRMWVSDFRERRVVSGFLKDAVIGKKRLASMPDRITNTIQAAGGFVYRPTVINCYPGEITTLDSWFAQWLKFFFDETVDLGKGPKPVYSLLQKIKQAKYPDITAEEEAASVPLQIVVQGIFDAVLVNLMQTKGGSIWQGLRKDICESLNSKKNTRVLEILQTTYRDADVVFLQEAGNQLLDMLRDTYKSTHELVLPRNYNKKRNQNSVMLLRKDLVSSTQEYLIPEDGWESGDLLVVKTKVAGVDFTLGSFHGDTNGLLTIPMIRKVSAHLQTEAFLIGLDANTHEFESTSTQHVVEFEKVCKYHGLESNWGTLDASRYTTFNARTYLQPQLNKAAKSDELAKKGDRNPKDFILFTRHVKSSGTWRDNTGKGEWLNDIVFPSLDFPSDHAVISADLRIVVDKVEL